MGSKRWGNRAHIDSLCQSLRKHCCMKKLHVRNFVLGSALFQSAAEMWKY